MPPWRGVFQLEHSKPGNFNERPFGAIWSRLFPFDTSW